jgi:hypothetical protein
MKWLDRIISLYLFICDEYKNNLWRYCERFTNYANLSFTDEEVIVIYLIGILDGKRNKAQIHKHAKRLLV